MKYFFVLFIKHSILLWGIMPLGGFCARALIFWFINSLIVLTKSKKPKKNWLFNIFVYEGNNPWHTRCKFGWRICHDRTNTFSPWDIECHPLIQNLRAKAKIGQAKIMIKCARQSKIKIRIRTIHAFFSEKKVFTALCFNQKYFISRMNQQHVVKQFRLSASFLFKISILIQHKVMIQMIWWHTT